MIKLGKNHPYKQQIDFVIKAKSKDDIRPVYYHLYFKDNILYGTDSRRLHLAKNICLGDLSDEEELNNTFWEVIKHTKSETIINKVNLMGQFPNVEAIINGCKEYTLYLDGELSEYVCFSKLLKLIHKLDGLNFDFFRCIYFKDNIYYFSEDKMRVIKIINENMNIQAYIMPIKLD